jgi:aminopeptidase N
MTDDLRVPNRMFGHLAEGLWDAEQPDLCSGYVDRYLHEMPRLLHRRGGSFAQAVGWAFPAMPLAERQVALLRRVLDNPEVELLGTLRRDWEDAYDDLARRRTSQPART